MAIESAQKQYLIDLRTTGKVPPTRPDFNGLSETIDLIESVALESQGNRRSIEDAIASLSRTNAKLAAIVKEERTSKAEVESSEHLYPSLPKNLALESGATEGLCPLKDMYVNYSKEVSPEGFSEFHPSCFWGMLSMVAGRRIAINLRRKQYTSLIVMLSARSTLFVKTDTAEVQRDVLKAAGLDWMLGLTRTTPQKLLMDMAGFVPEDYNTLDYNGKQTLKKRLAMSGQRGWHYNEFGKLIKAMMRSSGPMADFVEILLQISDCPDELPSGTIARGSETVIKPYIAITGTLTPASIKAVAAKNTELWSDGFLARFLFACPPREDYIDSPFERGQIKVPDDLAKGISNWHSRLGEPEIDFLPILDEEGKETGKMKKVWLKPLPETLYNLSDATYEAWKHYRSALKSMISQFRNTDFDGSYGRLSMMALRVAALAASIASASQIEYEHWMLGQEQAEMWRSSLHQLYAQVNSTEEAGDGPTHEDQLVEYLKGLEKCTTAREILQYGPAQLRRLKSDGIRDMLNGLIKDGVVEKARMEGSKAEWYKYLPE